MRLLRVASSKYKGMEHAGDFASWGSVRQSLTSFPFTLINHILDGSKPHKKY
jgi:hypothetical protein